MQNPLSYFLCVLGFLALIGEEVWLAMCLFIIAFSVKQFR